MRFFKSAVLAVAAGAGVVMAQSIDPATLPECAATCLANMQAKFGDFACASAEDFLCLCRAPDWRQGIASCASSTCGSETSDGFQQLTAFANEKCAIVTGTPADVLPTPAAEDTPPEATSAPAESTPPPTEPTTVPEQTPSTTTTTDAAATEVFSSSTPTTLLTSTKATTSADGTASSGVSTESGTTDADSAASTGSSSDEAGGDDASSSDGISTGAKIGIAVGVGAAVVILLALLLALCCRRRDRKKALAGEKDINISSPMPGSGRSYASTDGSATGPGSAMPAARSKSAGKNDLELTSTRYENMVPRTQPSLTDVRK